MSRSGEPFTETAGTGNLIAIEAENYHQKEGRGGHDWSAVSLRHSSFEVSLQALPNSGTNRTVNYETFSPRLAYRFVAEQAGRYFLWVRAQGATDDDSLHIDIDGQPVATGNHVTDILPTWTWTSTRRDGGRAYVDIEAAGEHVLDAWMREDGVIIDKFILTTDRDFEPAGKGLVESRQSYETLSAPPVALDDGPFFLDEGEALASHPGVLDNDTDLRGDAMIAELVAAPEHASLFELHPDGTFDYRHDGSETSSDAFTYRAVDVDGASNIATTTLRINNRNDVPVIRLLGEATINLLAGGRFIDPGATASDEEDGDITAAIQVRGSVDTGSVGTYLLTYDVVDSAGKAAVQQSRTVFVRSNTPPAITLLGESTVSLAVGDTYTDAGATAEDAEDGDLTDVVVVDGTIDTAAAGTYILTYKVTDSDGNAAEEVVRTVVVSAPVVNPPPPPPQPPVNRGGGGGGSAGWLLLSLLALLLLARREAPSRQAAEVSRSGSCHRRLRSSRPRSTRCLTWAIRWNL